MNLPDYFLVDLPPVSVLDAGMIREACLALKRNRLRYLANRSSSSLVRTLTTVGENWLSPDYPLRKLLVDASPKVTGFSTATLLDGLDSFFRQLNATRLQELIQQDLGHRQRLDDFSANELEQKLGRAAIVHGPELVFHIAGGRLPTPVISSIALGLLARAAQFVKCASGATFVPRLFAHSIHEVDPKLAACLELAEWPGGATALESVLFTESNCVTTTGTDETLAMVRQQLPVATRFLGYGHRVSFAYVTREILSGFSTAKVLAQAAQDVAAWDQQGCLSPHVIYVETGGGLSPEEFAGALAAEMQAIEVRLPRGPLSPDEAAAIATRRAFYQVRAAHSLETRLWASEGSTAWTIVFEADPQFQLSCLNRFVYIKPVIDLPRALHSAELIRGSVSTVGLAATEDRACLLAKELARWGVTRVCPLGRMQDPPLAWRHDGRPALADLITWTDWEM